MTTLIPAHDAERTVAAAVRSAFAQRPSPPAEVLVVDDGSVDGTAVEAELAGARVLRLAERGGVSAARNVGLRASSQPWIATLDADDTWLSHHLAVALGATEGRVVVATSALACQADPALDRVWGVAGRTELAGPRDVLRGTNPIVLSGAVFRRDAALVVGGFDEARRRSEDLDLWVRLLETGPGMALPDVTVLYAVHPQQASDDREGMRDATIEVCSSYAGRSWCTRGMRQRLEGAIAWDAVRATASRGSRLAALRQAVDLVRSPQRLGGCLELLRTRSRLRRTSARTGRSGGPSVLVASDRVAASRWAVESFGDDARMSDRRGWRELLSIWRTPPGAVVSASRAVRAVARARRVRVIDASPGDRSFGRLG